MPAFLCVFRVAGGSPKRRVKWMAAEAATQTQILRNLRHVPVFYVWVQLNLTQNYSISYLAKYKECNAFQNHTLFGLESLELKCVKLPFHRLLRPGLKPQ